MDWVPIVLIVFKVAVLGTGMFFAIKWHYDQEKLPKKVNIIKVILECFGYALVVALVFALIYSIFHYLHLLPAGLVFY